MEVAHITSTNIPLTTTWSYDLNYLEGVLASVIFIWEAMCPTKNIIAVEEEENRSEEKQAVSVTI